MNICMHIFRGLWAALLYTLVCALSLFASLPVRAATFSIPNGDVGAFKAALRIARVNGQADTIILATNGTYLLSAADNVLSGSNGLPIIEPDGGRPLTLRGNGATIARVNTPGTPAFRLAYIRRGAVVSMSGLTLRNGSTTDWGGCINN